MKKKLIMLVILVAQLFVFSGKSIANDSSQTVLTPVCYEGDSKKNAYKISDKNLVEEMCFGEKSLGTLVINDKVKTGSYEDMTAYGAYGTVSFDYQLPSDINSIGKDSRQIQEDSVKKVAGEKIGKVKTGAILVLKSEDGKKYKKAASVVDINGEYIENCKNFYTASGEDVAQGMYYRICVAYRTAVPGQKTKGALWWKKETDALVDDRYHLEVYDFYLADGTGIITLHNLALDETDFPVSDSISVEMMQVGETLQNGSVTRAGFKLDKLGKSCNIVSVSYNEGEYCEQEDGARFTEPGRYDVEVCTRLGEKSNYTIYVSENSEQCLETYFGENYLSGERLFDESSIYPVYHTGAQFLLKSVSDQVLPVRGVVKNLTTGESKEICPNKEGQSIPLETAGEYQLEFYNGDIQLAGNYYHYVFHCMITDQESVPTVNYQNLLKEQGSDEYPIKELKAKHYEVSYQTTGGGYIYVCFSLDSYDEALIYAKDIERRFVEVSDGGYYYKSMDNVNSKRKYLNETELENAMEYYAKQNIVYAYFSALDEYSYRTYDNDLLECLEDLSIRESIRIFPSDEERKKMTDKKPYLNGFTFIQVSEFDTNQVTAYCHKNGKTYELSYGEIVDQQLQISSVYTITETNIYGHTTTYDAVFLSENMAELTIELLTDKNKNQIKLTNLDLQDNVISYEADSIFIDEIENKFDEYTVVTIHPDMYDYEITCTIDEMKNLQLCAAGYYNLKVIDRLGHYFNIDLTVSKNRKLEEGYLSYIDFYEKLETVH